MAPLAAGELRFVQAGYYYGPETMTDDAKVESVHEPDPSAIATTPGRAADDDEAAATCAFACLDDPSSSGVEPLRCVASP